jgi:hypothetical protein
VITRAAGSPAYERVWIARLRDLVYEYTIGLYAKSYIEGVARSAAGVPQISRQVDDEDAQGVRH